MKLGMFLIFLILSSAWAEENCEKIISAHNLIGSYKPIELPETFKVEIKQKQEKIELCYEHPNKEYNCQPMAYYFTQNDGCFFYVPFNSNNFLFFKPTQAANGKQQLLYNYGEDLNEPLFYLKQDNVSTEVKERFEKLNTK